MLDPPTLGYTGKFSYFSLKVAVSLPSHTGPDQVLLQFSDADLQQKLISLEQDTALYIHRVRKKMGPIMF